MIDYNIDTCTFVTYINYYLCCGVTFSNEHDGYFDVVRLENAISSKCTELTKNARFMNHKPDKLAAYIIYNAREQLGLSGWCHQL
jgi:hypothetical protein